MAAYTFSPAVVLIEGTEEPAIGATGVFRATEGGDPVAIYDLNDSPLVTISVGSKGVHQAFKADIATGVLDFGSAQIVAIAVEIFDAVLTVKATAESALSQAETLQVSKAAVLHTHGVADIDATGVSDSTTYLRGDGVWSSPEGGGTGFLDGGSATSTFSDLVIDGGAAA